MMKVLTTTLLALLAFSPLLLCYVQKKRGRNPKIALAVNIVAVFALCILTTGFGMAGHALAAGEAEAAGAAASSSSGMGYLAMALSTGLACIGGGIAVASAASSAIGAISENDKVFGKALIFVALAEGVAIYGVLVSLLIMTRL